MNKSIPNETIGRLFPYLRALMCLTKENTTTVSSFRLAELCNLNPAIIRKDFSYFGEFGKKGVGYNVDDLVEKIKSILNLSPEKKVALVGIGNIGRALLSYTDFRLEGFRIVMAFDNNPTKIGKKIKNLHIEDIVHLEKRIKSEKIQLAILAIPETSAPLIAQQLADVGVKAILSFAPCQLAMPKNIKVTCVDLSTEMARLAYYSTREVLSKTGSF
jgi:redox-sensing transcriptional repressor